MTLVAIGARAHASDVMPTPLFVIDAFASRPFTGNPAAVCFVDGDAPSAWMHDVAREMNLSETAFVAPRADGSFGLRWMTPASEVDLCGHATLASAHALWESGRLRADETARFHTRSGLLTARRVGDAIELDFPATAPSGADAPAGLLAALGVASAREVLRSRFDVLVVLDDDAVVRGLAPDFRALARVEARGVIVTARGAGEHDIVSRFFAPREAIDEDPVTGSAHCALAPYWAAKLGKTTLRAHQASRRGGELEVELRGERVLLRGRAITTSRGALLV